MEKRGWNERNKQTSYYPFFFFFLVYDGEHEGRKLRKMQNANINDRTNMSVSSWLHGCKGKQGLRILLEAAKFPEPGLIGNVKD